MPIPGRESPIIQFVRGESETLSLELFFDTYTYYNSEDVRNYVNKITDLLKIDGEIHAPPICSFVWGSNDMDKPHFTGIIERVSTTYLMFSDHGVPLRAKVNLSFRQYGDSKLKLSSPDKTKRIIFLEGDSLWLIAYREYGDPHKWRYIADANDVIDPLFIEPGTELIIPSLNP